MIRLNRGCSAAILVLVLAAVCPAHGQEQQSPPAGRIKVASGEAFVVRQNRLVLAQPGQVVYEADVLRTGANSRVGVTLNDDTRISIGPNSEIRLVRFVYAPAQGRLAFALNIVKGIAVYISGRIAKLSPDAVRLETPAAVIGVRGTRLAISVEPQ
jgi:hypothetical protein